MANRTSINDFSEAERIKVQNVFKNGIEASTAEEIELYTEWKEALAYQKALADEQNNAYISQVEQISQAYTAAAESALSAMEALKTEALERLERARNGQA